MVSIKELADDKSSLSSTRWAFVTTIVFDIIIISISVISYIVAHFIGKPFDSNLMSGVAVLLGVLTGIVTTSKSLQGFETKFNDKEVNETNGTV